MTTLPATVSGRRRLSNVRTTLLGGGFGPSLPLSGMENSEPSGGATVVTVTGLGACGLQQHSITCCWIVAVLNTSRRTVTLSIAALVIGAVGDAGSVIEASTTNPSSGHGGHSATPFPPTISQRVG